MLKIAYILVNYPSGSEQFIDREIGALQKQGVEIVACALRRGPDSGQVTTTALSPDQVCYPPALLSPRLLLPAAVDWVRQPRLLWHCLGEACHDRGGRRPRARLGGLRHLLVAQYFARRIATLQTDAIHAQFLYLPATLARIISWLLQLRYSVSGHAWDVYTQAPEALAPIIRDARFATVCTEDARQYLLAHVPGINPDKLHLIRHGLDATAIMPGTPDGKTILGIGRLETKKGFCYLIDACDILRRQGQEFRCILVGDGRKRHALQRMIDALELGGQVEISGFLSTSELQQLYRQATILALPSIITADGDRDGLANVVLEAMAAQLPVVTTTASAAHEAILHGTTGFLVPPHDPEALAACLAELLRTPQLRQAIGQAARAKVVNDFAPSVHAASLVTLLQGA